MEKNKSTNTKLPAPKQLAEKIFESNVSSLSRGITLIESSNPKHWSAARDLVDLCLPKSGNSIRIGITGVPGVGKSTFIESFGNFLVSQNHKVAVLAVDPSSSETKGSILGDKTRMASLSTNPKAYIRPSAAGTTLGGVARKTREAIILCEAAGYDIILIETVGVGQSEVAVHSMVDFFLLLKLSGAGDELQGIKRGIIEMADLIAINKADGDNLKEAKKAQREFKNALHLLPPKDSGFETEVLLCSAIENTGIEEIYSVIRNRISELKESSLFEERRNHQQIKWLRQTIEERLTSNFYNLKKIKEEYPKQVELIKKKKTTAFAAANYLLGL